MEDLEVVKRIAEIEGHTFAPWSFRAGKPSILKDGFTNQGKFYNPLTSDALFLNLILTHEVSINFNFCLINITTDKFYEKNFHDLEDLRKCVLLLIIEANNG